MNNIFFEDQGWTKVVSPIYATHNIDIYEKVKVESEENIQKYILLIDNLNNSCQISDYAGSKSGDGIKNIIFKGTILNEKDLTEAQRLLNIK